MSARRGYRPGGICGSRPKNGPTWASAQRLSSWVAVGVVSYRSTVRFIETTEWVTHTQEVLQRLNGLLIQLVDAETGQRGFLLTGDERFLEPYNAALAEVKQQVVELRTLAEENPAQQQRLDLLEPQLDRLLAELRATIDLRDGKAPKPR